jgi:nitrite reductase (NADH) small subunit
MSIVVEPTLVGTTDELTDNRRLRVTVAGREVIVFEHRGKYYAFENACPHLGGPAAEGKLTPRVEAVVNEDGGVEREQFDTSEWRLACPWHGFEFRIDDGICVADSRYSLRRLDVHAEGENIYVVGA